MRSVIRRIPALRDIFGKQSLPGILPRKDFHAVVLRERALVDRNNRMFSLLSFHAGPKGSGKAGMRKLAGVLGLRLRETDIAGWIDQNRIGVILADTPADGARKVARKVCRELAGDVPDLHYAIHAYPAARGPGEPGAGDKSRLPEAFDAHPLLPNFDLDRAGGRSPEVSACSTEDGLELPPVFAPPATRAKRLFDLVAASLLLLAFAPLLLAMALYIRLVSPGPILFRQERIGFLGRKFSCLKFRTMHVSASTRSHEEHVRQLLNSNAPMTKLDAARDPRVIPGGQWLRACGLDELPQLINVLRGEMSLVGPRPCIEYEFRCYSQWHRKRCDVLPGITGLWQVSGKNETTFVEMMRLDASYTKRVGVLTDLKMLLLTVPTVASELSKAFPDRSGMTWQKT